MLVYAGLKLFTDVLLCYALAYGFSPTVLLIEMNNPLKTWFFELIEDAIGHKAMQQFKKEEKEKVAKKDSKANNQQKED